MRKRSSLTRRIVAAVIGCLLLVLVLKSSEWQTSVASYIAYPFISAKQWASDSKKRRAADRESRELLLKRLHAIVTERDMLLRQLIERESIIRYESDSCEVREFKKRYHLEQGHVAQVMMINRTPAGHFMFVSSGAASGIEPDMVVLAQNALIGRVSQVYPHYSKIQLITDKNCRVAAVCTKTGARGIHEGCNDEKTTHLSFVSHFDAVEVGDMVVSQGSGLVFPRGFALGRVRSITPSGVFHLVDVEPIIDLKTIDFCLIVRRQDVDVVVCAPVAQADKTTDKTIEGPGAPLPVLKPLICSAPIGTGQGQEPVTGQSPDVKIGQQEPVGQVVAQGESADLPRGAQTAPDQTGAAADGLATPDGPADQISSGPGDGVQQ